MAKDKCLQGFGGNAKAGRSLGRPRLKSGIILKWILRKQDGILD
jgi:hypothetical protein